MDYINNPKGHLMEPDLLILACMCFFALVIATLKT